MSEVLGTPASSRPKALHPFLADAGVLADVGAQAWRSYQALL